MTQWHDHHDCNNDGAITTTATTTTQWYDHYNCDNDNDVKTDCDGDGAAATVVIVQ